MALAPDVHGSLPCARLTCPVQQITAWVAILAVPTLIAGVYGMNFDNLPETTWKYGYYGVLVLVLTLTACTVLYLLFKRNRWL